MKVTVELVDHLANLSRITLDEKEKQKFVKDFEGIVGYFDKLQQIDTNNVVIDKDHLDAKTELRSDESEPCLGVEKVELNAPKFSGGAVVVPQVVE